MTRKMKLSPSYAARMAKIAKTFDFEHEAQIDRASITFKKTLIVRPIDPQNLLSRRAITRAVEESELQDGSDDGLRVKLSALLRFDCHCIVRTQQMVHQGTFLIVYKDQSVVVGRSHRNGQQISPLVQVLPTPLKIRRKVARLSSYQRHEIKVKFRCDPKPALDLHFNEIELVRDGLVSVQLLKTPTPQNDWLAQIGGETDALMRRMADLPRYHLQLPQCKFPDAIEPEPQLGCLPTRLLPAEKAAYFARSQVTDDCAHLGHMACDPEDPVLVLLKDGFEMATHAAYYDLKSPDRAISARLMSKGAVSQAATLEVLHSNETARKHFERSLITYLGPDALTIASRFDLLPFGSMRLMGYQGSAAILRETRRPGELSAHRQISIRQDLTAFRVEMAEIAKMTLPKDSSA